MAAAVEQSVGPAEPLPDQRHRPAVQRRALGGRGHRRRSGAGGFLQLCKKVKQSSIFAALTWKNSSDYLG